MNNYTPQSAPTISAYMDNDPSRLTIKAATEDRPALNQICNDCILCGTNCDGTDSPVWTGCIVKPWCPDPHIETLGARSRHGINPAGLAQAAALTRTAFPQQRIVSILYSVTADAIKAHIRKPGQEIRIPSTYEYITTANAPMSAAEILKTIDNALDLAQELPF